jgi:hypothetical protein
MLKPITRIEIMPVVADIDHYGTGFLISVYREDALSIQRVCHDSKKLDSWLRTLFFDVT